MTGLGKDVVPALRLEQLALGELSADEETRVRARLADAPGGGAHLSQLAEDTAATLAAHPPAEVAAEIARRLHRQQVEEASRRPVIRRWIPLAALGVPLAAGLLILTVPAGREGPMDPEGIGGAGAVLPAERSKGSPRLVIHRQTATGSESLAPETQVRSGDLLQLSYSAAGMRYGAVMSVDGRGVVTQHLPETGASAVALTAEGRVPLPHAYELDDAPGFEHFVFVTSPEPFALTTVEAALRAKGDVTRGSVDLPPPLSVIPFTVRKEAP